MIKITTDCCGRSVTITEGDVNVHAAADATGCTCCPQDHDHGSKGADETPCRPVTVDGFAGTSLAGG